MHDTANLPPKVEFQRTHVQLHAEHVSYASTSTYPHTYPAYSDTLDLDTWASQLRIAITDMSNDDIQFDIIGIDASLANALRRILIAEVPTMAIEQVYVFKNTSVLADEVLAHRLGLVPICADPTDFSFKGDEDDPTDTNTITFQLTKKCTRNPGADKTATLPEDKYLNSRVLSKDIVYKPQGRQKVFLDSTPKPAFEDILLLRLGPGQEIDLELHVHKGIGKDHAKFSPVCTAYYRLHPDIFITSPIQGPDALKFQSCFPKGTIGIDPNGRAYVANARKCTMSRECLRHPEFRDKVVLARRRDHFMFQIETCGQVEPAVLFVQALDELRKKAAVVLEELEGGKDVRVGTEEEEGGEARGEGGPGAREQVGQEGAAGWGWGNQGGQTGSAGWGNQEGQASSAGWGNQEGQASSAGWGNQGGQAGSAGWGNQEGQPSGHAWENQDHADAASDGYAPMKVDPGA